tara:strand:- start:235 stop:447 length:213 start_codon:yes stop_codon:yes gene_type:complete
MMMMKMRDVLQQLFSSFDRQKKTSLSLKSVCVFSSQTEEEEFKEHNREKEDQKKKFSARMQKRNLTTTPH